MKLNNNILIGALVAALGFMAVPFVALAGDANQNFYVSLLNTVNAPYTNAPVDVAQYKGNATIVVNWGTANAAASTGTVTVTHSTTSGGTYTTVTNLAGTAGTLTNAGITTNEIDTFQIDLSRLHKWVKLAYTMSGTATNKVSGTLVAPSKSQ